MMQGHPFAGIAPGSISLVLSDPPWKFASNSKAKPGKNAQRHYECMTVQEISLLPVRDIAAKDSLLLLWATAPMLEQALTVMNAWGFRYVSQLVWPKQRIGTGYWVRGKHELLLVGKRGRFPAPRPALFPSSVILGMQREHSRKPDWVQDVVDARLPDVSKLEMFARKQRPGWLAWGNEVGKFAA